MQPAAHRPAPRLTVVADGRVLQSIALEHHVRGNGLSHQQVEQRGGQAQACGRKQEGGQKGGGQGRWKEGIRALAAAQKMAAGVRLLA
jgi:hypothetical protein